MNEPQSDKKCQACWVCLDDPSKLWGNPVVSQMILCPECGNKRCPKAAWHGEDCTGSNEPGQKGSNY